MLKLTNPRLRRFDVVVDSFNSCVSDAAKEFSRTPKVSMRKMSSEPGVFFEKVKGAVAFKQLKSLANTHSRRKLNKQVDVVNSDVQFIDFTLLPVSNLSDEELTIHSQPIEFERVLGIFNFPHKVESILSKGMFKTFQIHFLSPEHSSNYIQHLISGGLESRPSDTNQLEILNFEDGDSSQNLKVWVPSPWM